MPRFHQRHSEAAQRAAERRRREDDAPRLAQEVPTLKSLYLELQEKRAEVPVAEATYVRRVVVEHAPALFELPCHDSFCKNGGHDLTHEILRALRSGLTRFEGQDDCRGNTGTAQCQRVLHYIAVAEYS